MNLSKEICSNKKRAANYWGEKNSGSFAACQQLKSLDGIKVWIIISGNQQNESYKNWKYIEQKEGGIFLKTMEDRKSVV